MAQQRARNTAKDGCCLSFWHEQCTQHRMAWRWILPHRLGGILFRSCVRTQLSGRRSFLSPGRAMHGHLRWRWCVLAFIRVQLGLGAGRTQAQAQNLLGSASARHWSADRVTAAVWLQHCIDKQLFSQLRARHDLPFNDLPLVFKGNEILQIKARATANPSTGDTVAPFAVTASGQTNCTSGTLLFHNIQHKPAAGVFLRGFKQSMPQLVPPGMAAVAFPNPPMLPRACLARTPWQLGDVQQQQQLRLSAFAAFGGSARRPVPWHLIQQVPCAMAPRVAEQLHGLGPLGGQLIHPPTQQRLQSQQRQPPRRFMPCGCRQHHERCAFGYFGRLSWCFT